MKIKLTIFLSAIILTLNSCSQITAIEATLSRIEDDNDSLRAELVRIETEYLQQQQRDFLAYKATNSGMLIQIDEKVDVLASNVDESNVRITEINNRTGVITDQFREQARIDSLKLSQENAERKDFLQLGVTDFNLGNYRQANETLDAFLVSYPEAPEVSQAVYWSGEAHLAMMQYDLTVERFSRYIQEFPEGEFRAASIYKLGLTYQKKEDTARRDGIWKRLIEEFPDSREAQLARDKM